MTTFLEMSVSALMYQFVISVLSQDVQQNHEAIPIKEEQEQLWSSQKGGQLHGPDPVKSEDGKEYTQSSQPHQRQTKKNREAEPLTSSSTQQMEPGSDGEDCGGSQLTRASDPDSHQPVSDDDISDCSQQAENIDYDWKLSMEPLSDSKPWSHLKTLANNSVPEGREDCNTAKKPLNCPEHKTFDTKSFRRFFFFFCFLFIQGKGPSDVQSVRYNLLTKEML